MTVADERPVYRPDIDGLRAIAVIAVVTFHAFPSVLPGGFVGVDVFFAISGYLITSIILRGLAQNDYHFFDFYVRRIKRIFPALIVVMATTIVAGWFLLFSEEYRRLGKHIGASAAFLSNFFFWREAGYFDAAAEQKPLLHLWSLGIEEQFYVVWPLLLYILWKRQFNFKIALVCICGASFALNVLTTQTDTSAAFYNPLARWWELAMGGLVASLHGRRTIAFKQFRERWSGVLSFVGLLLIGCAGVGINRYSAFPGWWAIPPIAGTLSLLAAGSDTWINRNLLSNRLMVAIGLISFPLYLWHWPLLSFWTILNGGTAPLNERVTIVLLSVVLATITYFAVEKPLRHRAALWVPITLSICMLAIFGCGAFIYADFGIPKRNINASFENASVERFYQSRRSDESCQKDLELPPLAEEVCLTNSTKPRTMFVGDSHAMALYSAIFAKHIQRDAILIAGHSCDLYPNLTSVSSHRLAWGNNCTNIAQQAIRVAASIKSVSTIFIVNKAPEFRTEVSPPFLRADHSLVDRKTAFVEGNGALIASLLALGKRVIYVEGVPIFDNPPADCEARVLFMQPKSCALSKAQLLDERQLYTAEVAHLKAIYPALIVVDSVGILCPEATCRAKAGSHYLYEDEQHLSVYGSEIVLSQLFNAGLLAD